MENSLNPEREEMPSPSLFYRLRNGTPPMWFALCVPALANVS